MKAALIILALIVLVGVLLGIAGIGAIQARSRNEWEIHCYRVSGSPASYQQCLEEWTYETISWRPW